MLHSKPRSWAGTCDGCFRDVQEDEPYYAGHGLEIYCSKCADVRSLTPNINLAAKGGDDGGS